MKSRWTTCLLLAAVVAVWGVVAWRILAPARPAAPDVRPATDARRYRRSSPRPCGWTIPTPS
ncbi:MAG: hypothetical protein ACLRZL_11550 [Alistipes communis]